MQELNELAVDPCRWLVAIGDANVVTEVTGPAEAAHRISLRPEGWTDITTRVNVNFASLEQAPV